MLSIHMACVQLIEDRLWTLVTYSTHARNFLDFKLGNKVALKI